MGSVLHPRDAAPAGVSVQAEEWLGESSPPVAHHGPEEVGDEVVERIRKWVHGRGGGRMQMSYDRVSFTTPATRRQAASNLGPSRGARSIASIRAARDRAASIRAAAGPVSPSLLA